MPPESESKIIELIQTLNNVVNGEPWYEISIMTKLKIILQYQNQE